MSGHSHWATIKHKKGAIDAKRGKLWSKLSRAIIIAARHGGGDPETNLKLRYAIGKAREDVRTGRTLAVPEHLRDAHYPGAKKLGHGGEYKYSHDFEGGWVDQAYLPEDRRYYEPVERGSVRRHVIGLEARDEGLLDLGDVGADDDLRAGLAANVVGGGQMVGVGVGLQHMAKLQTLVANRREQRVG